MTETGLKPGPVRCHLLDPPNNPGTGVVSFVGPTKKTRTSEVSFVTHRYTGTRTGGLICGNLTKVKLSCKVIFFYLGVIKSSSLFVSFFERNEEEKRKDSV
jgi:hypothetical protein